MYSSKEIRHSDFMDQDAVRDVEAAGTWYAGSTDVNADCPVRKMFL